jgi:hypothetical protein
LKLVAALFFVFMTLWGASGYAQTAGFPRESGTAAGQKDPQIAVELYPNPATDFVTVSFVEPVAKQTRLMVHNIIGNALDVEVETIDDHEIRIRVKDLPVGYYLVAIRDEQTNGRSTLKFLKR